jgi:hypothetical protein
MKPIVDKKFLLEKFHGKGGWTYVIIKNNTLNKKGPFGWVRVRGTIDDYEIRKYHLMPTGKGSLMLPVKAEIRKKINKGEGDYVHVILYPDDEPLDVPEEMLACLRDEPNALKFFNSLSESERKYYIEWIYSAKREETKVERMARTINRLTKGLKMYDPDRKDTLDSWS